MANYPSLHWRRPHAVDEPIGRLSQPDPRGIGAGQVEADGRETKGLNPNFPDWRRQVLCHGPMPVYCRLHRFSAASLAKCNPLLECVCAEPVALSKEQVRSYVSWHNTPSFDSHGWRFWPGYNWNYIKNNLVVWG
jgi:hypothetical protein